MNNIRTWSLICIFVLLPFILMAQRKHVLSGTVRDQVTSEPLTGAYVTLGDGRTGTTTYGKGNYNIEVPQGKQTVTFSFLGYSSSTLEIELKKDTVINIFLGFDGERIEEIKVFSHGANANISRTEMGVESLTPQRIRTIPALMGEVDVLKAVQLLPGVQSTSEGSSGFSVRGGSHDQNLILLDDATVYNASHLMGFFSVFNNDVVKDVTLYKGDIPATFGGRLSSLLDISTRDGDAEKIKGSGGIGVIASRLTLEGPIAREKAGFLVSGRRTYADLFLKLASDEDLRKSTLYFYDANLKLDWQAGSKDRLYLSGYLGRDKFGTKFASMDFGNKTLSLKWSHVYTARTLSNISLTASGYDYKLGAEISDQVNQFWKSRMADYGASVDFVTNFNRDNSLRWGYNAIYHNFLPGEMVGRGDDQLAKDIILERQYAMQQGVYVSSENTLFERLKIRYGLRMSVFSNISNGEPVVILENYQPSYEKHYKKGKLYNSNINFEPRFGASYLLDESSSVKASYARTAQYIQLASNSAAGSPLDVWFQSSPNIKPQVADQMSVGYFRNFSGGDYEFSVEVYYKDMRNVIDFKDHADLLLNEEMEQEVRTGKGYSYGLEMMLRKDRGRLNGWISYTYSRAKRKVDEINEGNWFRSPYDRPHNLSVVATYELNSKWSLSANWIYSSGTPVTYPTGRYRIENEWVPIYSGRNEYRFPSYHRLDLAANVLLSKPGRKVRSELNFSLYNAYGRKNPWSITFKQEEHAPYYPYAEQIYLFTFIPSVTWNFSF